MNDLLIVQDERYFEPYLPCVCLGHSICSEHGEPEASGAAAAERRFPPGGDHSGQHSQTAQLSERLQRGYPLADAALRRVR